MAKQSNKLPRELKQLEAKEIDPSLLHIRELRCKSVNEESNLPHIKQPPTGPNGEQNITASPINVANNLPPPISQSAPETYCTTSAQSSSELDTGHGNMLDETIKQVTHKLHQTTVTSDIDNFNLDRTSAILNKPITTPSLINPGQDRMTTPPNSTKHQACNQNVQTKVTT